ncbi:MAG: hypothetical protein FWD94_06970, partial [Treponema sp.]|nr:hypothetical protein [Treponema sp.]
SSDSLSPLRRGIEAGFTAKEPETAEIRPSGIPGRQPRIPPALRNRWKEGAPVSGSWFSLGGEVEAEDSLDEARRDRERVRLLLARWGILCRPLLAREEPPFSWSALLPAIRLMELAGELVAGRFFAGIESLQFASPAIAAELDRAESLSGLYWLNATDPANPAGLGIRGLDDGFSSDRFPSGRLPERLASTRLYFQGRNLLAVSRRNGRDLEIFSGPEAPEIAPLIGLLKIPRTRKTLPEGKLVIESINGTAAPVSPFAPAFRSAGFIPDRRCLYLW